jgi:hypothetical protein
MTDVSIWEAETVSAILAEPLKSQDPSSHTLQAGQSTARNRNSVTCQAHFFYSAELSSSCQGSPVCTRVRATFVYGVG